MSDAGHQHGTHGSHGVNHSPGGGDGLNLSQVLGHNGPTHNFLSHLLGLDHNAHVHGVGHGQGGHSLPSQSASWSSALQSVKLSDALQGIKLTPNQLFIMLFASFIGWLFVVYWVRHHEPLADSVLGVGAAQSATAAADRQLIAGTKFAFPARTCEEMGDIYVPGTPAAAPLPHANYVSVNMPFPAPPVPPVPAPEPQPMPLSAGGVMPGMNSYAASFGQTTTRNAYLMPIPESAGTRLRMIVNR